MADRQLSGPLSGYIGVAAAIGIIALFGGMLHSNKPLQTALVVMASKYVTRSLPLLEEPAGMLVAPAVLLYFLSCAAFIWLLHRASWAETTGHHHYVQTFVSHLEPFVVAFAAVRGIRHFEDTRQGSIMLYMAICYIVVCPVPAAQGDWRACAMRVMDSFACRGLISAFNNFGPVGTAVSGLQTASIYALVLIVMEMFKVSALVNRVRFCKDTFCFSIAQEVIAFIQSKGSAAAALYIFAALSVLLLYPRCFVSYDSMCTVILGGLSVAAAAAVDAYLLGMQQSPLESLLFYGALFVALQLGLDLSSRESPKRPEGTREIIMISASIDSYADADYL